MSHYTGSFLSFRILLRAATIISASIVFFIHLELNSFAAEPDILDSKACSSTFKPSDRSSNEELDNPAVDAGVPKTGESLTTNLELESKPFTNNEECRVTPVDEAAVAGSEPSSSKLEYPKPDWDGLYRDVGVTLGVQVAIVALTFLMPESLSAWTPNQTNISLENYKRNFVNPVMDKDKLFINYILHPYAGGIYYIRARERGLSQTYSFAFSALMSAMYELGTECIFEKPSIQDLIVTPIAGSLLGAYIFEPWRESIKNKPELRWYDHTVLVLTDPLGVVSLGVEKIFGIKSTIVVNLPMPQIKNSSPAIATNSFGVTMQFPLK